MPSLRGIEISLVAISEAEVKCLPEFPHPDGPSSSPERSRNGYHGADVAGNPDQWQTCSPSRSSSSGTAPRVSVYVPSLPNTKFFFSYTVTTPPAGTPDCPKPKYLFFKVFINGRAIVAWGINLRKDTSGTTYRALYGPGGRYRDPGSAVTQPGIEARYFWFLSEKRGNSVADDGGLIEVQVFRSIARVGRAPALDPYRTQDKYGIGILSEGMIDKPEEAAYYDYHLMDPRDCPYAAFRFHYRSWNNLRQLHLVPQEEFKIPFSRSEGNALGAMASKWSVSEPSPTKTDEPTKLDIEESFDGAEMCMSDNKGSKNGTSSLWLRRRSETLGTCLLSSPPQLRPSISTSISQHVPEPSKAVRDAALEPFVTRPLPRRPLPEIPVEFETRSSGGRSARSSSGASKAPSITPSLLPYVEGESFVSESVEVGVAKGIDVVYKYDFSRRSSESVPKLPADRWADDDGLDGHAGDPAKPARPAEYSNSSPSDYEVSLASTDDLRTPPTVIPPSNYLAATSDSHLERQRSMYNFSTPPPRRHHPGSVYADSARVSPKAKQFLGDEVDFAESFAVATNTDGGGRASGSNGSDDNKSFRVTESEWMGSSVKLSSPHRRHQQRRSTSFLSRLWSPRPGRGSKKPLFGIGSLRDGGKNGGRDGVMARSLTGLGGYTPPDTGNDNWI